MYTFAVCYQKYTVRCVLYYLLFLCLFLYKGTAVIWGGRFYCECVSVHFYSSGGAKEWCILILRSIPWSLDICHRDISKTYSIQYYYVYILTRQRTLTPLTQKIIFKGFLTHLRHIISQNELALGIFILKLKEKAVRHTIVIIGSSIFL